MHEEVTSQNKYRILISFNNERGSRCCDWQMFDKKQKSSDITAMHLSLSDELHSFNIEDKEKSSFEPI
jgi:hypothetical protein